MSTSELTLLLLRLVTLLTAAVCVFSIALPVLRLVPVEPPTWGIRGRNRAALRMSSPAFAAIESWLGRLAGVCRALPLTPVRTLATKLSRRAGEAGGLCADELIALSVITTLTFTGVAVWFVSSLGLSPFWLPLMAAVGALLPSARLDGLARERAKALERSLPSAMDLCVLCMGAGTDFPSALAFATRELGLGHEVCREELSVLLEQLSLGRTRVEALEDLSIRSGSQTVQQFVAAVCQSERARHWSKP